MENNFDRFEENIDLFDAYLQAEMTPEERVAFEARLATDPIFSKEFDLHHALLASMERNWEREKLRELVQTAVEQNEQKLPRNERSWRWWIVAVILLLLFVIGVLFFIQKNEPIEPTVIPTPPTAAQDTIATPPVDTILAPTEEPPVATASKTKDEPQNTLPKPANSLFKKDEYKDDVKAGETLQENNFNINIPVKLLVIVEGKLNQTPNLNKQPVEAEIMLDDTDESIYRFFSNKLTIFTPYPEDFSQHNVEIREIKEEESPSLFFFKASNIWYQIFPDGKVRLLQPYAAERFQDLLKED